MATPYGRKRISWSRAKNCIRIARERVEKALQYSYRDRHNEKRDMRSLWIQRINAGTRFHSVNYGNFMHGLMKENIQLNWKVLSELSMHEPLCFKALVDISRNAFPGKKNVVHPPKKDAGPATEAIVAHWGCPDRMMRDSSFGVERLRIPRSRKSESAVAFAACSTCDPVIINSGRKSNPVKSFCIGDANGIPFSKASIRGPPGLLPAMHGHIEMFSMMPQRLYWLFDVPVSLGPFSSGHRRAAAFVTRIGISVQIWSDLRLVISKGF
ncbi:hypothetical protein CDL15_Pgr012494 [Punica granatum]|uniref:Large ribosomal subunit protein bL20c n=1 Tax=Punica granatum TaxID=22663 RepID=A0A218WW41_PUNGR|nr:hypothetical protein CDL15_Pgr012494 [Punica granatum]